MADYVESTLGVKNGIKFWEKAFENGLNKHSIESMRRHWRLISKDKPFRKRGVIIPISKPKVTKSDAAKKVLRRKFEKLVQHVSQLTRSSVTHRDVYNALVSNLGNVEQTLLDFALS